ncbi:MAG: HAD family hydrolase [bacterium]
MTGRLALVTLDLDGTLLPNDMAFAAILRGTGHAELAAEAARKFADGTWSLPEAYAAQWRVVQTLGLQEMHRALRKAAWLPGIADGVRRLQEAGLRVVLLTDVASTVTDFLGRWGLVDAICSPVTVKDGRQLAIDQRLDKLANLNARLAEWNIPLAKVCHVGNGPNDIPVFRAVGASLAVFPQPEVAEAASAVVPAPRDFADVVDAVLAR